MSLLIVYQGHENIKANADFSYSLDVGQVSNTASLNNPNKLNDIALKLRDEYCDYIFSINKQYLKNNLIYNNKLSLYFISDLSNKRTEIFETFSIVNKPIIVKTNINTASFKEILSIPYIDYELCLKIFDYKDEVAELQSISEIKNIEGFPLENYTRIVLYLHAE